MRIYDPDSDQRLSNIILYLTPDEANELMASLEFLLKNKNKHHEHIPDRDENFQREITVSIYKKDDLSGFDERSKRLILNDE